MYVAENELPVSNWLSGEPRYGCDCAVITNTNHGTGWKSVNCSTRHTTLCVAGKIIIILDRLIIFTEQKCTVFPLKDT